MVEARAVAARDRQLASTVAVLPSLLQQSRITTTHLGQFSGRALPVLSELTTAFNRLVPAVAALGPAAASGRTMLHELDRFDRAGTPLLARLRRFSHAAYPIAPQLDGFLRQINPLLRYLDPYAPEVGAFFANQRSITSSTEGPGKIGRIQAVVSSSTLTSFPPALQSAVSALLKVGAFELASRLGNNAYPRPGAMPYPKPFSGRYSHITADAPARLRRR